MELLTSIVGRVCSDAGPHLPVQPTAGAPTSSEESGAPVARVRKRAYARLYWKRARLLSAEGLIVGISYAPALHGPD